METILNLYRNNLVFSIENVKDIEKAIENEEIRTDHIIEDFWQFREEHLKNLPTFNQELILDFNEHYDNGLTHAQNFIRLVEYIDVNEVYCNICSDNYLVTKEKDIIYTCSMCCENEPERCENTYNEKLVIDFK